MVELGNPSNAADQAVADRVARLRSIQAQMSGFEARIMALMPPPSAVRRNSASPGAGAAPWWGPVRAIAVLLGVAAVVGVAVFDWSVHPAMASAQDIAQLHQDALADRANQMPVNSMAAASKALAGEWPHSPAQPPPALPIVPRERVTACCVNWVRGKPVACVLINHDGSPLTMTVARLADLAMPLAPAVSRGDAAYCATAVRGLNMVMTQRDGSWVCLIGKLPSDQLLDVAGRMQF